MGNGSEFDLAQTISILVGFVIPLLVGLLSRANASRHVKAILNFGLSALAAALSGILSTGTFKWSGFAVTFALTWATSVASYYGLLKPTGAAQSIQAATSGFGVGGGSNTQPDGELI